MHTEPRSTKCEREFHGYSEREVVLWQPDEVCALRSGNCVVEINPWLGSEMAVHYRPLGERFADSSKVCVVRDCACCMLIIDEYVLDLMCLVGFDVLQGRTRTNRR
jgi:hypothetical protein